MSFKWNEEKHTYELGKYSSVESAKKYLDNIANINFVITSDEDYKVVQDCRKELNRLVKELSTERKQMTAIVLSSFAPQCIEIEKYGVKLADELTAKMEQWKPKPQRDKVYKLTIKTTDLSALKKIEKLALKFNCEVTTE